MYQLSFEMSITLKLHNSYRAMKGLPPITIGDYIREDLEHKDNWDDRIAALTRNNTQKGKLVMRPYWQFTVGTKEYKFKTLKEAREMAQWNEGMTIIKKVVPPKTKGVK